MAVGDEAMLVEVSVGDDEVIEIGSGASDDSWRPKRSLGYWASADMAAKVDKINNIERFVAGDIIATGCDDTKVSARLDV